MCTTHANADAHTSEHAQEPASGHCGHCSHDDLTLEDVNDRRAQVDRDNAARELAHSDSDRLHHTT